MKATIKNFLQMEPAGGAVLMAASALALVAANASLANYCLDRALPGAGR